MDNPARRSWDPNAISALWAEEIRRENIEIINQINHTSSEVCYTKGAIEQLKQSIDELNKRVNDGWSISNNPFLDVKAALDLALEKIEVLEQENSLFKSRFEALERENPVRGQERPRDTEAMRMTRVHTPTIRTTTTPPAEVRQNPAQGRKRPLSVLDTFPLGHFPTPDELWKRRARLNAYENGDTSNGRIQPGLDALVPEPASQLHRKGLARTLTETTWGSSIDLEALDKRTPGYEDDNTDSSDPDTALLETLVQGDRTLADYLSHAERIRPQLSPKRNNGDLMAAFLRGLNTRSSHAVSEEIGRGVQCSWDYMRGIAKAVIDKEERAKMNTTTSTGKQSTPASARVPQPKTTKKRRSISIVSVDEEDDLLAAGMP